MLGKTIARLRKAKGLTQAKFADLIHVTQGAISQWETGRTSPDVQQMFILADFFGITVEELSSGTFTQEKKEQFTPIKEMTPAEMRAEGLKLVKSLSAKGYEEALQFMKYLKEQENK